MPAGHSSLDVLRLLANLIGTSGVVQRRLVSAGCIVHTGPANLTHLLNKLINRWPPWSRETNLKQNTLIKTYKITINGGSLGS